MLIKPIKICFSFFNNKYSILALFFACLFYSSFAQKENNQWIISNNYPTTCSFIDFNSGLASVDSVNTDMGLFLTNASICDTSGQLLFYTNGHVVYNRNHDSLMNTSGINPGWATTYYEPYGMGIPQGAFIIPRPGHYGQYYLFYESAEFVLLDSVTTGSPINLGYSLIDMSLDNGLGGIVAGYKNLIAINDTLVSGRITGVKHANGRDWWIIKHHYDDDLYYTLLVTPDAIIGPFSQHIGRPHLYEGHIMQSCFSQQGDKFIMVLTENLDSMQTVVDLFDFDRCNGFLSNAREIEIPDTNLVAIGCSFSPSGRWLYVNTNKDIYQYDTWSIGNINNSRFVVATWDTAVNASYKFYHQLLGPDGKTYVTNWTSATYLHVITNPDSQGIACNVVQGALQLPVFNSKEMPNATNYSLGPVTGSVCDSLTSVGEMISHDIQLQISPNPSNGQFSITYGLVKNKDGELKICNILGELVYKQDLPQWSSLQRIILKNVKSGIYFINITSGGNTVTEKILVNKSN